MGGRTMDRPRGIPWSRKQKREKTHDGGKGNFDDGCLDDLAATVAKEEEVQVPKDTNYTLTNQILKNSQDIMILVGIDNDGVAHKRQKLMAEKEFYRNENQRLKEELRGVFLKTLTDLQETVQNVTETETQVEDLNGTDGMNWIDGGSYTRVKNQAGAIILYKKMCNGGWEVSS
ncbi:hypothetical protein L1887_37417 [Cichorium endivia]|nr:hypothetical protein L1887_37417 [Cichorium endivia]